MGFVEAADFLVNPSPDEQARGGYGREFLGKDGARKVTVIGTRQTFVCVRCDSASTQDYPAC